MAALAIVIVWAATGPVFQYSGTWQLIINTGTTIITFLMVFLIQKAQNKDSKAIQIKLNELITANKATSNRIVNIENLTEEELDQIHKYYEKLSTEAEEDADLHASHSIDAAAKNQEEKSEYFQSKKNKNKNKMPCFFRSSLSNQFPSSNSETSPLPSSYPKFPSRILLY